MRHAKNTFKLGRNTGHRRSLLANMLKSLVEHERIVTTLAKAKRLRCHADRMITLAKKNTLASQRRAMSNMRLQYSSFSTKEARAVKKSETPVYVGDRNLINKLFGELGPRFASRNGGYTRIIKTPSLRKGDASAKCILEYLSE